MAYSLDLETVGPDGPAVVIMPDLAWDREGHLSDDSQEALRILASELKGLLSDDVAESAQPIHIVGLPVTSALDHELILLAMSDAAFQGHAGRCLSIAQLVQDHFEPRTVAGDPVKERADLMSRMLADVERTMKIAGPPPADHRQSYLNRNQAPRSQRHSRNRKGR